jgi:hypothetical protein
MLFVKCETSAMIFRLDTHPIREPYVHVWAGPDLVQVNRADAARILVRKVSLFVTRHLERKKKIQNVRLFIEVF